MLVYGDHSDTVALGRKLELLSAAIAGLRAHSRGLGRHSALIDILIEGGRLSQALLDREFERSGEDGFSPESLRLNSWLTEIAAAVCRSWDSRFAEFGELPLPPDIGPRSALLRMRRPEGYAFYALYPESYMEAARRVHLEGEPRVVGVRSIGTSLGAIVSAAVGGAPMLTVRPFGNPAARKLAVSDSAARAFVDPSSHYLVVDEGPGQSGSSFAAVTDWLRSNGAGERRITLLPSHPAGPQGLPEPQRRRWLQRRRVVADIGPKLPALLKQWASDLIGPVDELVDISSGAWRERVYRSQRDWPAVNPGWERRKFLASSGGRLWLVKFAGLGSEGERKLNRARRLHEQSLVAEPAGLAHGFLIERWEQGRRLRPGPAPLAEIARYLAARERLFPGGEGASASDLLAMARHNIALALGPRAESALDYWEQRLPRLEEAMVRVAVDGRMDPHEWIRTADSRLLKADALDHDSSHDLIGCQDIAWDLAGAAVEFKLAAGLRAELVRCFEQASGRTVDSELLEFLTTAYLAFRLGQCALSAGMAATDSDDTARFDSKRRAYEAALQAHLAPVRRGNDRPAPPFDVDTQRVSLGNHRAPGSVDEEEAAVT